MKIMKKVTNEEGNVQDEDNEEGNVQDEDSEEGEKRRRKCAR